MIEGSKKTDQIYGLDLIRFGSAVMVMCFHLLFWIGVPAIASDGGPKVVLDHNGDWASFGWVGVEIFFVISGYVIAASANGKSALAFLRSRIRRLMPSVWIAAVFALTVALIAAFLPTGLLIKNAARTAILYPYGPWLDIVYWTLAVEVAFYALIFALLIGNAFRYFSALLIALAIYSGGAWVIAAGAAASGHEGAATAVLSIMDRHIFKLLLLRHGCFFALGGLLWLCTSRTATPPRLIAAVLAFCGCLVELHFRTGTQEGAPDAGTLVPTVVWLTAVVLMYVSVRHNAAITQRLGRGASFAKLLGLITYPLYLVHHVPGVTLTRWLRAASGSEVFAQGVVMCLMLGLALLVVKQLEPLTLRNLDRVLQPLFDRGLSRFTVLSRQTTAVPI